jgi:hypothetical protein
VCPHGALVTFGPGAIAFLAGIFGLVWSGFASEAEAKVFQQFTRAVQVGTAATGSCHRRNGAVSQFSRNRDQRDASRT